MRDRPTAPAPGHAQQTWNDSERIAHHREMSPSERLQRTIAVSRATLRFARGARRERG